MTEVPCNVALVASILKEMLGEDVAIATAAPSLINDDLFPEERQFIARAVAKRQAEFGTARACARRALAELNVAPCPLLPNADRSPSWPQGFVGSISHTAGICGVAVGRDSFLAGLGLDLEEDVPLSGNLEELICTPFERSKFDVAEPCERGRLGKLIFSAKEAFYKCQFRSTETWLDFQDVELTLNPRMRQFSVGRLNRQGGVWNEIARARGEFRYASGLVITTAVLNVALP
jgi:4'-phosphopantetheinyl transferase EntD